MTDQVTNSLRVCIPVSSTFATTSQADAILKLAVQRLGFINVTFNIPVELGGVYNYDGETQPSCPENFNLLPPVGGQPRWALTGSTMPYLAAPVQVSSGRSGKMCMNTSRRTTSCLSNTGTEE